MVVYPHSEQNGCVGFKYNFIPHKSTKFVAFLYFNLLILVEIYSSILAMSTLELNKR